MVRVLLPILALALLVPAATGKGLPTPVEVAIVQTGRAPCGLAAHGDELWVGVYEAGTVLRLDRAGRVQRRHGIGRWPATSPLTRGRRGSRATTRTSSSAPIRAPDA